MVKEMCVPCLYEHSQYGLRWTCQDVGELRWKSQRKMMHQTRILPGGTRKRKGAKAEVLT